jgi:toxin secretion/phage lysis holin
MILNFNNIIFNLLILIITLDIILGTLRSLKEKTFNSTFGINGILRKTAMIISSMFLIIIDSMLNFNLLYMIPEEIKKIVKLNTIGIFKLFGIIYIIYESLSVLKNMIKCGLPIPKKLKNNLEKLLNKFTKELGGEKNE